jgi:hypothetical protein
MTSNHLSALTLDAFALDALDGPTGARVRDHLSTGAACQADHAAAAARRTHFTRHVLPLGVPERRSRHRAWLALRFALPALAAALIAIAAWPRSAHRDGDGDDDLAIKGGASWQVFAHRAGQTFAVHDGVQLGIGDQIRFVVEPAGARYLLVASVDGLGQATIYYPYGAAMSAPIAGDRLDRIELAGSIVLDAAPGPERVFALFSDAPIAAAAVQSALRAVAAAGPDAIRGMRVLPIAARAQASVAFEKAVP